MRDHARTRLFRCAPLLLLAIGMPLGASAQVDPHAAARDFQEAARLCERDGGRLWGISLCGPMVIFDQATGTRAASQPEPPGPPPHFPGLADGPVTWGGSRWFAWPLWLLPENDPATRQQNLLHGLFHRIQPELGLITEDGANEHLDTEEGRLWMRLEWRALRRAVGANGRARVEAITDALAFRRERRRLFPAAGENERRDEIREGLASYTGIAAWADSPAAAHEAVAAALAGADSSESLVGNFEAASGPAYGILLDDLRPGWRREVRASSDLGDMLGTAIGRPPTPDLAIAAARYDGAAVRAEEDARDRGRQARLAELRRRFIDGPVLTMPAGGSGTSDSRGSFGLPGVGTVLFNDFTLSGQWGRLRADSGVLRAADGSTLTVPVTGPLEGTELKGSGWIATLNPGWVVRPAPRPGSFVIVHQE